jgi:hypothetical protein
MINFEKEMTNFHILCHPAVLKIFCLYKSSNTTFHSPNLFMLDYFVTSVIYRATIIPALTAADFALYNIIMVNRFKNLHKIIVQNI